MPIYEFYCENCHTVFNFFSQRVNTETRPDCPKCGRSHLERQVSVFSVSRNRAEQGSDPFEGVDESRLEQAIMSMAGELEGLDQDNPQQAARAMRKVMDQAGIEWGDGVEEAIGRLEAGDDPDEIEATSTIRLMMMPICFRLSQEACWVRFAENICRRRPIRPSMTFDINVFGLVLDFAQAI